MDRNDRSARSDSAKRPWNSGRLIGQKLPLKRKDIWVIRVQLQLGGQKRDLALFNLAIDSKMRGCDLVAVKITDVWNGEGIATRAIVVQKNTDGERLGVIFATASPFDTPCLMRKLVAWTNESLDSRQHHPILTIAIFVVVFLEIHPFQDGNGRLSRILTTLLLLRAGYAYVPYSSLESVVEQTKDAYYLALRQTQGTIRTEAPNWQPWIDYFLKALLSQKRRLEKKIEREHLILGNLPPLSVTIMELVRERGRVSVADIVKTTGVSRNTIKDHLKSLTKSGHLLRHGAGRGTWYAQS